MSDLLGFIGDVGSALLGSNSEKANKTNVRLNGSNRHGKNACQTPRCKDASRI